MHGKLEIGMLAMIIGCEFPENTPLIGKVVTIEEFCPEGSILPIQYFVEELRGVVKNVNSNGNTAICSGVDAVRENYLIPNHIRIEIKYLMPLPPLEEDDSVLTTEKPKETVPC